MLFCNGCWNDGIKSRHIHEHKNFVALRLPHRVAGAACGTECRACSAGKTYDHCTRCLGGIREGALSFECRDCLRVFDEGGAVLCESCYEAVAHEEAGPLHKFVSFQYAVAPEEADHSYIAAKCLDCQRGG